MNQAKAEDSMQVDVDTRAAATLYITMIHWLVFRALMTGATGTLVKDAKSVFHIFLNGLRGDAPHRNTDADPDQWRTSSAGTKEGTS